MAKTTQVWGIDFGQCALKALRCHKEGDQVVATAFDYIEYPKILTQPEADAPALMKEALTQFLDRNDLRGCKVMISVPGQAGLSRFFKPPPVEAKRIPDIVRFEARQQIPFPLDEVIWDYQRMSGGAELDGVALDAEVGLFAMKREQVFKYIKPFLDADVELDVVQLAPLAIYNFVSTELLKAQDPEEYDSDDPPESLVVLSMGTDSTDLVVTNGFRVWQRSIPLGGNHFTRHLTKDLKLTFAKAEHLKRNARDSEDPKRVFQAMRPVFNDLVTEVQRSIGFFQGIDRKAKISGVVVAGNTVKLPGLQQYLAKNLGYEVVDFSGFQKLQGGEVLGSPEFKDNVLSFCVSYGLCLQGLGVGKLQTNLVPRELLTERMVRAKKPWAVAALSALLLGFSFQYFLQQSAWYQVNEKRTVDGVSWDQASKRVEHFERPQHEAEIDGHRAEDRIDAADRDRSRSGRQRGSTPAVAGALPSDQQRPAGDQGSATGRHSGLGGDPLREASRALHYGYGDAALHRPEGMVHRRDQGPLHSGQPRHRRSSVD